MNKVIVFIDGGFLSKLSKHLGGGIPLRYNLWAFSKRLAGKESLVFKRLFYYSAPPFQSTPPTVEERTRKERYDSFVKKLSRNKDITLRQGRCQKLNNNGKIIYKQKGVDTLLTMDLLAIPTEYPRINNIILIASDSDFVPIIEYLKKRGIRTTLYIYFDKQRHSRFSTSNELLSIVSRHVQLKRKDFED